MQCALGVNKIGGGRNMEVYAKGMGCGMIIDMVGIST